MKVLVTDGNYNQSLAIVRSLGRHRIEVSVLSTKPNSIAGLSKYCKQELISPPPTDEGEFINFLCKVGGKFDLLIPVGSNSVRVISRYRNEVDKVIRVGLPTPETVFSALNKRKTYEIAKRVGVSVPWTIYPASVEEVESIKERLSYPVVIKALEDTGVT